MAVTQDEERAAKISSGLKDALALQCKHYRNDNINAPWGKTPSFQTRHLYKFNSTSGVMETLKWHVHASPDGNIRCDRVQGGKSYASLVTGTKNLAPIDRLYNELVKRYTKALRNAWCETVGEATTTNATTLKKPMLLHKWDKHKQKIKYPCYVQPKHDGIRAIYDGDAGKLFSRSGKVILLPHITDNLKAFDAPSLDGEIAFDDWTVPLPEVVHAVSAQDRNLKFIAFDCLDEETLDAGFEVRFVSKVTQWFEGSGLAHVDGLRICQTEKLDSEEAVHAYYQDAVAAKMEGIVVRNIDSPMDFGRRTMLTLKYKLEYEEEFLVEGYQVVPHPDGDLVQFICTTLGKQFEVVPAWTHNERRACLSKMASIYRADAHIGGLPSILIEYRGTTKDGIPYHAVGKTKWKDFAKKCEWTGTPSQFNYVLGRNPV